jgi:uncharacterized RDD family membrane protein YckC
MLWYLSMLPTAVAVLLNQETPTARNSPALWILSLSIVAIQTTAEALIFARFRATIGMLMAGQRFCDQDGNDISFRRCLGRIALGWVLFPLLPVTWILILLDDRRRTLADRLTGVRVMAIVKVDRRAPRGFPVVMEPSHPDDSPRRSSAEDKMCCFICVHLIFYLWRHAFLLRHPHKRRAATDEDDERRWGKEGERILP